MVSICITVMCVFRLDLTSHLLYHQGVRNGVYSSCGVRSTTFTEERNMLNLRSIVFFTFYVCFDVDDGATCNLNKMMINSRIIVCTNNIFLLNCAVQECFEIKFMQSL